EPAQIAAVEEDLWRGTLPSAPRDHLCEALGAVGHVHQRQARSPTQQEVSGAHTARVLAADEERDGDHGDLQRRRRTGYQDANHRTRRGLGSDGGGAVWQGMPNTLPAWGRRRARDSRQMARLCTGHIARQPAGAPSAPACEAEPHGRNRWTARTAAVTRSDTAPPSVFHTDAGHTPAQGPLGVVDRHGRPLRSLRLSVTDRCNLRCTYCMPEAEYRWLPRPGLLTVEECVRVVRLFVSLGVDRVRLTGGEPLLRPELPELISRLAGDARIRDLALTTNG